ncbi:MAG: hypothetical protein Q9208_008089 [Pyrenodesmia sp. 3 TL-2023]
MAGSDPFMDMYGLYHNWSKPQNYTTDITDVSPSPLNQDPYTYIKQSEFLKSLNYSFNLTHSTQITRIAHRGKKHLAHYHKLYTMLHNRVAIMSNSPDQAHQQAHQRFQNAVHALMLKSGAHIVTLDDMITRAQAQDTKLRKSLMATTGWFMGPPPILELESVFRPGQMLRILFERNQWVETSDGNETDEDDR